MTTSEIRNPQSEIFDSNSYLNMELLRFTTAGSVDDGKSTLIGRLLYDSKSIFEDQYENIKATSERRGESTVNLALFTDGLKAEREQGITIDVAYRYFSTPKRKFIIADTPGHIQYTRNMVTGASTANLAIILVDARQGIVEQTRRHSIIASLLGIPHIAVCINKMDLVNHEEAVFNNIVAEYREFATRLKTKDIHFIPISALNGDNVVHRSENMKWCEGVTLMYLLENIHIASDINHIDMRFPVQYVVRPYSDEFHDYRGYAGRISSGVIRKGDKVIVLPSGFTSTVKSVELDGKELKEAFAPLSVTVQLEDDIDISRGDMLVREGNVPKQSQDIEAMVCWMGEKPIQLNGKYFLKHTSKEVRAVVKEIKYKMDINSLHRITENPSIGMNDVGRISLRTTAPLCFDAYTKNRDTGSFILIEEGSNVTVGACMIID
ncbi:MAG: sulfate adenylyltransferase subunit CysN [Bacteroidetes bacterium]|nr:sulfate adenylyltransferase subunit CysN [Bacteroidota bacterium]